MSEKKPMTKTQKRVSVVVITIFVVVFIFVLIMAINESINKAQKNKMPKKSEYSLNEPMYCENGSVSITVTNTARQNHSTYDGVNEGDELIAIYLTVKNGTDSDYSFSENSFQLVNGNGEVIKPLYGTIREMWEGERLENIKLASGGEKSGYIVFKNDIENDTNASLRFNCNSSWLTSTDEYKTISIQ